MEEMIYYRERIISLFDKNIKKYPPCVDNAEEWYRNSLSGAFQLWGFIEDDLKGVALSTISGNTLNFFGWSGKGVLKDFDKIIQLAKDFAKEHNVRYIQSLTIPALARTLWKNYHQRALVMVTIDIEE